MRRWILGLAVLGACASDPAPSWNGSWTASGRPVSACGMGEILPTTFELILDPTDPTSLVAQNDSFWPGRTYLEPCPLQFTVSGSVATLRNASAY